MRVHPGRMGFLFWDSSSSSGPANFLPIHDLSAATNRCHIICLSGGSSSSVILVLQPGQYQNESFAHGRGSSKLLTTFHSMFLLHLGHFTVYFLAMGAIEFDMEIGLVEFCCEFTDFCSYVAAG